MDFSTHSPPSSEVFSSLDSQSPPPTPIAKRGRHFLPSNVATPPTPLFFPTSQSIFGSSSPNCHSSVLYPTNKEAIEKRQLALVASRPVPRLQLMPRSTVNIPPAIDSRGRMQLDQLPPLPFPVPDTCFKSIEAIIPPLPFGTDSSKSCDSARILETTPQKPEPVVDSSQNEMLSTFQPLMGGQKRNGVESDSLERSDSRSIQESKKLERTIDSSRQGQGKFLSFHRSEVQQGKVERRNSFVARSA